MNSSFNLIFPPVQNIRERLFLLEEQLAEYFTKPFTLIPLPNEAPVEIPRISATTHHGFSTLNLSLNSLQLITNFNNNFGENWENCENYLRERIFKIVNILRPLFSHQIYCGLTINLMEKTAGKSLDLLLKNFSSEKSFDKIYDLFTKYTFTADDNYYINIQLQNQRLIFNQFANGHLKEIEQDNLIGIALDINDRYAVNYIPGYLSNEEKIDRIFKLSNVILKDKLKYFIYEGKFDI
jgi:hypothetical protein